MKLSKLEKQLLPHIENVIKEIFMFNILITIHVRKMYRVFHFF